MERGASGSEGKHSRARVPQFVRLHPPCYLLSVVYLSRRVSPLRERSRTKDPTTSTCAQKSSARKMLSRIRGGTRSAKAKNPIRCLPKQAYSTSTIQSMTNPPPFCSALRQRAVVVRLCHLLLLLQLVSRQANAFPSPRITGGRPAGGESRTTLRNTFSRPVDPARSAPRLFVSDKEEEENAEATSGSTGIDTSLDSRLYKVRLSRAVGIE